TRFVITCEPEGAATIRAILTSPLAAPAPDTDGPDPRTAPQRRYDALLTVLGRGMTSPEGTPTTTKASLVITLPYDVLRQQLTGTGTTLTGQLLSASVVRKLACQAEIIPMVLGSDSEVLDQGRATRTVTKGQLVRLWHRDGGCTYPGCSTPPHWCHAHHIRWWTRDHGPTDINNLTLLCARHHTHVHDHDLTATITTTGVTWHRR
uniref:HNH endonuclease signature motif containing protein n=1 Tax=Ornithinicoccus halotolerans TaxID=1748220 RepID=UPI0012970D6E